MPPAIPLVAMAAGAYAASAAVGAITLGVLGTGLFSAGVGIAIGGAFASIAGFAVTTALSTLGSRAMGSKAKGGGASSYQEARGQSFMARSSVESHKIVYGESRTSGPIVFISTTSRGQDSTGATATGDNLFLHMVIALAGHEVEDMPTMYLNDAAVSLDGSGFVQTAPYLKDSKSYVRINRRNGSPNQVADAALVEECSQWSSNHRLRGVAYAYARLQWNAEVYLNGTPNISAAVRGRKVFDPRSGLTVWSRNAALCARDYLASDYGFNCDDDEINDDFWGAAANVCDENVTLRAGGTQKRYTVNGVVDTAAAPIENLSALVASMAGAVTYVQGRFRGHAGAYDTPVGDITMDMVVDDIKIVESVPRQELFNRVQGTFVDPGKGWQPTDFPPVMNALYETQDGGEAISTDVVLTLTNHPEAAQRIAKVLLEQGRQGIQVDLALNHKALSFAVWDTVRFTNPALGWTNKVFRIKSISFDGISAFRVSMQEESSASYDWNNGEASIFDAAPDTNLPNPSTVAPPSTLTVTEELYVTRDGSGVKAKAVLTWLPSPDAFVREYQAEMKLSTDTEYTLLPRTTARTIDALDIAPGIYNFRVKALNTLNASSTYAVSTLQISGLSAPPTEPQNLYWSAIGGLAYMNWDPSPDLDVRIGGKYVFRYSPDVSGGWGSSTSIGNAVSGNVSSVVLPLKPGIYLVKAEDSSGNQSAVASSVIVTQDTIFNLSVIATVTENPTYTGTKTNCSVASSKLSLTNTTLPGTYLFATKMDLTTVKRVRLTAHLKAAVVNPSDLFDDGDGLFDDGDGDYDGLSSASADAVVFVRSTQTDPNTSPTWTAWNRLDASEFSARGFDFKVELVSHDSAFNIEISELNVKAAQ